nr:MAG TPA: hypothetical protein [Caudoviricetes sp.]DAU31984.1 MAG TPA: hypothetical protein [Caudoviricetes sp.]
MTVFFYALFPSCRAKRTTETTGSQALKREVHHG